ncbi:hypothetical protein ACJX0J_026746 [Zea mays]
MDNNKNWNHPTSICVIFMLVLTSVFWFFLCFGPYIYFTIFKYFVQIYIFQFIYCLLEPLGFEVNYMILKMEEKTCSLTLINAAISSVNIQDFIDEFVGIAVHDIT